MPVVVRGERARTTARAKVQWIDTISYSYYDEQRLDHTHVFIELMFGDPSSFRTIMYQSSLVSLDSSSNISLSLHPSLPLSLSLSLIVTSLRKWIYSLVPGILSLAMRRRGSLSTAANDTCSIIMVSMVRSLGRRLLTYWLSTARHCQRTGWDSVRQTTYALDRGDARRQCRQLNSGSSHDDNLFLLTACGSCTPRERSRSGLRRHHVSSRPLLKWITTVESARASSPKH